MKKMLTFLIVLGLATFSFGQNVQAQDNTRADCPPSTHRGQLVGPQDIYESGSYTYFVGSDIPAGACSFKFSVSDTRGNHVPFTYLSSTEISVYFGSERKQYEVFCHFYNSNGCYLGYSWIGPLRW